MLLFSPNILQFFNGGHPATLDDYRALQNALKAIVRGIFEGLTNFNPNIPVILSGVDIGPLSAGVYPVSAGWVYWSNNIWYCPAHTITSNTSIYWAFEENIVNNVLYVDGQDKPAHIDKWLYLKNGSVDAITDTNNTPILYNRVTQDFNALFRARHNADLATQTYVTTLLAAFRNGYDVELDRQINPATGNYEICWRHTNVNMTPAQIAADPYLGNPVDNPWRFLGVPVIYVAGTNGVLEVHTVVDRPFVAGNNVLDISEFAVIQDLTAGAWISPNTYVNPTMGEYNFLLSEVNFKRVSDLNIGIPIGANAQIRVTIGISRDNVLLSSLDTIGNVTPITTRDFILTGNSGATLLQNADSLAVVNINDVLGFAPVNFSINVNQLNRSFRVVHKVEIISSSASPVYNQAFLDSFRNNNRILAGLKFQNL